ncbi:MAG TPA: DnaJ domain-containing protein [Myxococcota bacterium]|nr:DnaJ domain-containing protein [Myxococcota bacterium]
MQTGTVADQPIIELLCSLAAQKANGRLEVRNDNRRRAFYFEGGRLSLTKSNLKSESMDRLKERHPDSGTEALLKRQAQLRLRNVVRLSEGEWEFVANVAPKDRRPFDLIGGCWLLIQHELPEECIDARLVGHDDRFPRRSETGVPLDRLPLGSELKDMLRELDGTRTLEDIIDFAPADPKDARKALYLGLICGCVSFDEEGHFSEVRATGTESEDEPSFSISDLIAGAVGGAVDKPPDEEPTLTVDPGAEPEIQRLRQELVRVKKAEDAFEALGIHWDASEAEYRKAYFALARDVHPDRWATQSGDLQELASEVLARLNEHWEKVSDSDRRKAYVDSVIHGIKTEDELAMEKVRAILDAEDRFKQGLALHHRGDVVRSHEIFREIFEMVPEEAEFRAYYGYTTFKLNWANNKEKAQEGVTMIKAAIDDHVKLDSGWVLLGLVFRTTGQHKKALSAFKRALEMNPANTEGVREYRRSMRDVADEKKKDEGGKGLFGRFFGKK